jgi:flagellin-like protein
MNRKAQSEVVSTILLILIVLAAVGILWYVVNTFMKDPFGCSKLNLKIVEARAQNSQYPLRAEVEIQRLAGGYDDAVKDVKIIIINEEGEEKAATIQGVDQISCTVDTDSNGVVDCEEDVDGYTAHSLKQVQTKTYKLDVNDIKTSYTVKIAPIVLDEDGNQNVCEITDTKLAI